MGGALVPLAFLESFAGLEPWQAVGLAALFAGSLLVGFLVRLALTKTFGARYAVAGIRFSESSRKGVRRAVAALVAIALSMAALPWLQLPDAWDDPTRRILQFVAVMASVWLAASLWNSACDALLSRSEGIDQRAERLLVPVTRKLVSALILVGGFLAMLAVVGVNVAGVLAGIGIGGLVLALAAKDSVENLFGSLTILFDMPFHLGDWVKIGEVEGVVEEINLRSTRIRTFEDSVITLPNSNLIKASVENFGARRSRRQRFFLRFGHDATAEQARGFADDLRQRIAKMPGAVEGQTIVELNEITEQWLGILVQCRLAATTQEEELGMRSWLISEAMRLARDHGLRFSGSAAAATSRPPTP